ncbi:DNA polymerase III subunit epsilon [bacterium endosymbiont of Escarpia laminata]|nr:MAG: DNA polymerase III subunit epsilon [bacterium endosymbiont of Escarpia laminata]RLJ20730.1 MAG: DNA polymerase III subunit epsilon [bacterium endosymbiont of Escarpia laminata]
MNIRAVIDFETTGLSPGMGARPTEIAVVLIDSGTIIDRYQSLMNPGVPIPYEIQTLTGITDKMVKAAPPVESVMQEAAEFVDQHPLVAHNAAFDRKFWNTELRRIDRQPQQEFICSMLLARRIFPEAPNHKLGTLVQSLSLPDTGRFHRALADAEATAYLLLRIESELMHRFCLPTVSHELLLSIQKENRSKLASCVSRYQSR